MLIILIIIILNHILGGFERKIVSNCRICSKFHQDADNQNYSPAFQGNNINYNCYLVHVVNSTRMWYDKDACCMLNVQTNSIPSELIVFIYQLFEE